ncbi:hypothetical protein BDN72DRAFT_850318 [Pluteus cervinus]|uniref:Uncharacterized protein n=1 Tax=Pluteus cervinus TaxID=181527 RepID=A0ACD3A747_9AGAR|nr:hypothetical protein BDN72DRAFT_850318 [Pluteus cervinus]
MTVIMFVLATLDLAVTWKTVLRDYPILGNGNGLELYDRIYLKYPIYVTNNIIADALLVHRCYAVWGNNNFIIAIPALMVLVNGVLGYLCEGSRYHSLRQIIPMYIWCVFLVNTSITILTAARIAWVAHKARRVLGHDAVKNYATIVAIVIESGFLYSLCVLAVIVFPVNPYVLIVNTISIRIVCIMPCLIVVQIGLGRAFEMTTGRAWAASTREVVPPNSIILDTVLPEGTGQGDTLQSILSTQEGNEKGA